MGIYEHVDQFCGHPVRSYQPGEGMKDLAHVAWRLDLPYDEGEQGRKLAERVEALAKEPGADRVRAVVIGTWEEMYEEGGSEAVVRALARASGALGGLRGIFVGDIVVEECEISWIKQTDVSPLLAAWPSLEHFRVRGGDGLSLGSIEHASLRSLVVETGGLSQKVVRQVASAQLPELTHLELWMGTDEYGADWVMEDLEPILEGALFPKLEYLGLRNSHCADAIAEAVTTAPVLGSLRVLDLSLGTLSDEGAEHLLVSRDLRKLAKLDLHHHYLSDRRMGQIQALGIEVDLGDRQEADEDDGKEYRYVAVGE